MNQASATAEAVRQGLRTAAQQLGTQVALARALGVSPEHVNAVLQGRRKPTGRMYSFLGLTRVGGERGSNRLTVELMTRNVERIPGFDCWIWAGTWRPEPGLPYGTAGGRSRNAHRLMWELLHGAIPRDIDVCHHCDVPPCINPDHLFLGTARANVHDCIAKGRFKLFGRPL